MIYQFRAGVYICHFKFNLLESLRPLWLLPTRWGLSPVTVPVLARPPPRQTPPFNASERPGLLQKVDAGPGMEQSLCCRGMAIPRGQVQWCQGKPFLHWGKKLIKLEEGARFHRAKRVTWPSICIRPRQTFTVFRKYLQYTCARDDIEKRFETTSASILGGVYLSKEVALWPIHGVGFSKHRCIWPFPKNSKA